MSAHYSISALTSGPCIILSVTSSGVVRVTQGDDMFLHGTHTKKCRTTPLVTLSEVTYQKRKRGKWKCFVKGSTPRQWNYKNCGGENFLWFESKEYFDWHKWVASLAQIQENTALFLIHFFTKIFICLFLFLWCALLVLAAKLWIDIKIDRIFEIRKCDQRLMAKNHFSSWQRWS